MPIGEIAIEKDVDLFHENLRFMVGDILDQIDWSNVFLAGGAVLSALRRVPDSIRVLKATSPVTYREKMKLWFSSSTNGNRFGDSDLDLFIHGLEVDEATQKLKSNCAGRRELCARSAHAHTPPSQPHTTPHHTPHHSTQPHPSQHRTTQPHPT